MKDPSVPEVRTLSLDAGAGQELSLVGLTANELVSALPALMSEVAQFTFMRYAPKQGATARLSVEAAMREIEPALADLRMKSAHLYERIIELLTFVNAAEVQPERALDALLGHDDANEERLEFRMNSEALTTTTLEKAERETPQDKALALSSLCVLRDGGLAHIPLIDFKLPVASGNTPLIVAAAHRLGLRHAAVLESGRSYHVYGLSPIAPQEWSSLLIRALLLTPMVDVRYIAHRLLAGRSVLRITANSSKPEVPRVVAAY